jgi:response regulator of citrate/malate metabolism
MLSSSDEMSDITKTTRLGVMSFLTKEVHCDSLVATLDRFVALKSV